MGVGVGVEMPFSFYVGFLNRIFLSRFAWIYVIAQISLHNRVIVSGGEIKIPSAENLEISKASTLTSELC